MKQTASKPSAENLFKQIKTFAGQNKMLEAAIAMSKVHSLGYSPDDIMTKLKRMKCIISKPHIYNYLKLADAPAKVKNHISKGNIKASEVLEQMHKHQEPSELIKLVDQCVEERKESRELKKRQMENKANQDRALKFREKLEREAAKYGYLNSPVVQSLLGLTGQENKKQGRSKIALA